MHATTSDYVEADVVIISCCLLQVLLGCLCLEAPVMTPDGADFSFLLLADRDPPDACAFFVNFTDRLVTSGTEVAAYEYEFRNKVGV